MRAEAFAIALSLAGAASAAEITGTLAGVVVDAATQAPVAEAQVTARGPALLGEQSAVTDQTGAFEMTFLPAGTYGLSVKRDGFQPFLPDGLVLRGRKVRIRLALLQVERAAPPPPPRQQETAVEFNDSMTAPSIISGPNPEYTPEAVERGIEGVMQVRCAVTVTGAVRRCKVLKGLPYMDRAVVDALEARKYKPALLQGKPVDVFYTFTLLLKLPAQ